MYVEIPLTGMALSRSNLGILVVILDVLIIFSLVLAYLYLGYFERLEDKEYNEQHMLTEDFAVSIKNLPKYDLYDSLQELKAMLWDHLEDKVFSDDPNNQIVNIHFARADLKKLKILIAIKKMKT